MASVKLVLEYDGTNFSGWAAQPGVRTVEGELAGALSTVLGITADMSVAGRTDAGVHAWGQVASFELPEASDPDTLDDSSERLARSLNGVLPPDVAVLEAGIDTGAFDARLEARSRTYCYRVLARSAPSPFERGRALWVRRQVDAQVLGQCASALAGKHDFTAFTPTQTDHVRFEREVMSASWQRSGDVLEFWIEADTFMRHMVRILVGTMLEVAFGTLEPARFTALLGGAPRSAAGPTAEPHGLYLASVRY
jgi:tRNA pseudouridine38-40 synthase